MSIKHLKPRSKEEIEKYISDSIKIIADKKIKSLLFYYRIDSTFLYIPIAGWQIDDKNNNYEALYKKRGKSWKYVGYRKVKKLKNK